MDTKIKIESFIEESFKFKYEIDEKKLQLGGLLPYIKDILSKSSLRIGPLSDSISQMLEEKISLSIKDNKPIVLVVAIGGFKNKDAISFPHIDWAELMQLQFLLDSVSVIAGIYKPGLRIEYTLDSFALNIVDNYKIEDIQIYVDEFRELLKNFEAKYLPKNVALEVTDFFDFYELEDMRSRIDKELKVLDRKEFKYKLNDEMDRAINDFMLDGDVDYTKKSKVEIKKLREESILRDHIWLDIDIRERVEYLEGKERIPIVHRPFPDTPLLAVKSYKGSDLQFWAVNGMFEVIEDRVVFRIVSKNQLKKSGRKYEKVLIDLGLGVKNLEKAILLV
jgi:hypothetical protein